VHSFRKRYGLDKALPEQYGLYLYHLVQGDLGQSEQNHDAVRHDLAIYIPATVELGAAAVIIACLVGIGLGTAAALRRNGAIDHLARMISLTGISTPAFWLALVSLYLFFFRFGWVPGGGRLDAGATTPPHITGMYTVDALLAGKWSTFINALHHLVLPAFVLAAANIGVLTRYTRSAVLEVINNDYVQSARAKGLPERTVLVRHVLRAALPSILTVFGLVFANVLTGAVVVEKIFTWPGVGEYAYQSSVTVDLQAIAGVSLFAAIVYITINFVIDVLYAVIDPRIELA
jgi:peptide/nickel transport system permease protein